MSPKLEQNWEMIKMEKDDLEQVKQSHSEHKRFAIKVEQTA